MIDPPVLLYELTRKNFREARERGEFQAAIVPTGSTEQHDEHLPMIHDTANALYIAEKAAQRLYPQVVVTTPIAIGVSEHWMMHPGTLTLRKETFQAVVFDVCHSLARHGLKAILILNGHAGNHGPLAERWDEFRDELGIDLRFCSYWSLIPRELAEATLDTQVMPGHACEFETSTARVVFPELVRDADLVNEGAKQATADKGQTLLAAAIAGTTELLRGMLERGKMGN